jgi:hypothetical protein
MNQWNYHGSIPQHEIFALNPDTAFPRGSQTSPFLDNQLSQLLYQHFWIAVLAFFYWNKIRSHRDAAFQDVSRLGSDGVCRPIIVRLEPAEDDISTRTRDSIFPPCKTGCQRLTRHYQRISRKVHLHVQSPVLELFVTPRLYHGARTSTTCPLIG